MNNIKQGDSIFEWILESSDAQLLISNDAEVKRTLSNAAANWILEKHYGVGAADALPDELHRTFGEVQRRLKDDWYVEGQLCEKLFYRATVFPEDPKFIRVLMRTRESGFPARQAMLVFENNVAGIYETDLDGKILSHNKAFCDLLGYTGEELESLNGSTLYLRAKARDAFISDLNQNGFLNNYEVCYRKKDGTAVWCLESAFLAHQQEQPTIVGTVVDITEQKHLRNQYESLFYSSVDAVVLIRDGEIIEANRRFMEIYGCSKEDLSKLKLLSEDNSIFAFREDERELLQLRLEKIESNEPGRAQLVSKRRDGSQFFSDVQYTRIADESGPLIQMIIRDVSERVLYEEALRDSEERFKKLSEVALEGVVFVVDDHIRDCNQQFVKLFGYRAASELYGKSIKDFVNENDLRRLNQTLEIKSINRTEIHTVNRTGNPLVLEATGSNIEYQDTGHNVYLFYDITARKRAEQALEQSTERFRSVVEHSPNGIFILTDGKVRYSNQAGVQLFDAEEEDDFYGFEFAELFVEAEQVREHLAQVRDGEDVELQEYRLITLTEREVQVGLKGTLSVYNNMPSIQVTLNNLTTRMKLMQESLRAELAEEINVVLKREIEEHKQTQQKLREAENFMRNIIQSSIDMIVAVDKDENITEFNPAAEQLFGYSQKDILGKPLSKLYASEKDYKKVLEGIRKESFFSGEVQNVTKSGNKFTSLLSASVIRDDDGNIVGSMGVSRDVTELKKAEREIRESEERYRDLFENASDLIFAFRTNGTLHYANKAFLETLGYTKSELRKLRFQDIVLSESLAECDDFFEEFAGKPLELDLISKSGKYIRVFGDSSIRFKNGKPDYIRAIFRDITDLRRHEQSALEQGAKLESIFNSTENMMMWTLGLNGQLTSFNNNFRRWVESEFGAVEAVETDFLQVLHERVNPDAYQRQLEQFGDAYGGKALQFELPLLNKHEEETWLQVFVNPVRIKSKMEEVSVLAYDITDRKEIDRKILDSLKEKEVLLQEVHHRVKNNLQVISSILNLQSSFVDDERTLELLAESQERIKTMSYIHETLYQTSDFSSIEFTDYINTLVRNLIQSYAPKDCEIILHTEFDSIYLNLDQAIPCGLILNELVSNALKYAFPDRDKGNLTLCILEKSGKIEMTVADDGVGLPEDFKYEESESLGIYLVYALTEQLDATINVESKGGTRFLITFDKQ